MNPIKRYRMERGISQEALARVIGVSSFTVSHWETGDSLPRVQNMTKLAQFFMCNVEDLIAKNNK